MPKNVLSDVTIELTGFYPKQYYPEHLRLVRYWDEEQKREFVFLTNAMHISALQVAELYKNRWQVELFFNGKLFVMQSRRKSYAVNQDIMSQLYTTTLHNHIISEGLSARKPDHGSSPNHVPWLFQEQGLYKLFQELPASA